jgi:UDP-3-O-[3-hydroxymyristoyl] glucosamine N-acyltransferase
MLDRRFLLGDLAEKIGAQLKGDADISVAGLATIQEAGEGHLTFIANPAYQKYLGETKASAVILSPKLSEVFSGNCLIHDNPYLAYAKLSALWDPVVDFQPSISEEASIHESVVIGEGVFIAPGVRLSAGAVIGDNVYLGENVVIGADSIIGNKTRIYPSVTIYHGVVVGEGCTIQSGCVIGSDGFGFAPADKGWQRISQLGGVTIGNSVEIGANTTIDRGALDNTVIHDGVILDNQIQIAHNVVIGENTAIAACSAIAGSTTLGKNCVVGGASGIAGHLEITDGVHITAMTMVIKSLPEPGVYSSGTGVQSNKDWKKSIARLRRLDNTEARLRELERQFKSINSSQDD